MTRRQLLALLAAGLTPDREIPLEGDSLHVQGLVVSADRLLVTTVDRAQRQGLLLEFDLQGHRLRQTRLDQGSCYHPGGFDADAESLYIPVAEYSRNSKAVIQRRARSSHELLSSFTVPDHIGALTRLGDRLIGANWDARRLYEWSLDGQPLRVRDNPSPTRYQDLKARQGLLAGSGLAASSGRVEWLNPESLAVTRSLDFGSTRRNVLFTHEGMDLFEGTLYLLPEDGQSIVYVFRLPA